MKAPKLTELEAISLGMLQLQYNLLTNGFDSDLAKVNAAADIIIREVPSMAASTKSLLAKVTKLIGN